jgi:hypothetical protein
LDPDLPDTILKGDHLRTIVTKFGFNWPSSFRGEYLWMKKLRRTDGRTDGRTQSDGKIIPWLQSGEIKRVVKLKFIRLLVCWNSHTPRNEVAEGIMFLTSPRVCCIFALFVYLLCFAWYVDCLWNVPSGFSNVRPSKIDKRLPAMIHLVSVVL